MVRFYCYIILEYLLYFLFGSPKKKVVRCKTRQIVNSNEVIVHTHEWAGYEFERKKVIKYIEKEFVCGLRFAIKRLTAYTGGFKLRKILTISDNNTDYISKLENSDFFDSSFEIYSVPNIGMDFSGYNYIYRNCLSEDNQYLFLTNTSVNGESQPFIDEYIKILSDNPQLGLLGISYSSKIYQTLVKSNYTPHVQSFFILTTTDVLKEIVHANDGIFPGAEENYKLSIIRFGEAKLSQIANSLGYDIGIVNENGALQILPTINDSSLVDGDYRLYVKEPNRINRIK
ncbi:hypothetical protein [Sphingobacterium sp. UDSM-2020]|uniref:hypothetical protein n=1 Tax=Sphingobacterium sp. UDSM-2020 TaxID=2795738 RepID=UPI0019353B3E|nr:hypothetical protein [Sphingobacterium sp. UDSM-2020]QQD15368.1 hypothetical protein JAZ75_07595 [Sphingobacterium sp. UDSM-2020]